MEAKELQRKIAERKLLLKAQTDAASARSLVGISTVYQSGIVQSSD